MHSVKLSDIENAFKSLKPKFPVISIDNDYITIDIGTGWLITNRKKFEEFINEEIFSKVHY